MLRNETALDGHKNNSYLEKRFAVAELWRSLADLRHMVVYKKECGEIIRKELFASHYEIPLHLKMCFANCRFP